MAGEKVVVELLHHRTLSARALWWIAGRFGVAFETILGSADPLLEPPMLPADQ